MGEEVEEGNTDVQSATINGGGEVTLLQMEGNLTKEQVDEGISLAREGWA